jgi:hypothetical protein
MRLFLLIGILSMTENTAQTVGPTGCTTSACVFANPYLRFGTGSENSVNSQGLFVQPWYFSETSHTWYKLTFNNYPLDTAIGVGSGTAHWSGTTVYDVYSLPNEGPVTDYSNFIVNYTDSAKTVGYGQIVANRTLTIGSTSFVFQNIFSLGQNDKFVKIVTRIINFSPYTLENLLIWTGTRDDYVGLTDVNSKTRGNLNTGSFVPITAVGQSSRAIMISNTNEGVLFYSETPGVKTSFALCCAFSNAYNTNPNTLAIATTSATDGSYAAVLPFGNVSSGQQASIIWYYAAGTISSLSAVAQSVAAAQVADAGIVPMSFSVSPSSFYTFTSTKSTFYTPSAFLSDSATSTPSVTPTASTTSTFPLKFVYLNDTRQITTSVFISTESQATSTALYALISVNIVIALSCACCTFCALCLLKKVFRDKKEKGHLVIRREAF